MIRHGPNTFWANLAVGLIQLILLRANEDILKSHTEYILLMNKAINTLEKLMPSFHKDTSDTSFRQLRSLIDYVNSPFESFEKSIEVKVKNEFEAKRLCTLKKMISNDRPTLSIYVKSMQDSITVGGNLV